MITQARSSFGLVQSLDHIYSAYLIITLTKLHYFLCATGK